MANLTHTMIPKGKLIIIGGHEDKGDLPGENLTVYNKKKNVTRFEILGKLVQETPRAHHEIEIIAAASSIPIDMEQMYITAYEQEGFTKVSFIKVGSIADAHKPDSVERIKEAHAVFFTGGDQGRLVALIQETPLLQAIRDKYYGHENFIIAGTSAGAMALPEIIITGGLIGAALYKDDIKISRGLNFISGIIVDTHFIKRGRIARLAHAIALNPVCLGIGLEENTALIISGGNHAECIGSGMVITLDGRNIKNTNIGTATEYIPIVVENLQMSIIAEGVTYSIKERKFIKSLSDSIE